MGLLGSCSHKLVGHISVFTTNLLGKIPFFRSLLYQQREIFSGQENYCFTSLKQL